MIESIGVLSLMLMNLRSNIQSAERSSRLRKLFLSLLLMSVLTLPHS
jgi:hypothetical protein